MLQPRSSNRAAHNFDPLKMLQRLHYVHQVLVFEGCNSCSQIQYEHVLMSNLEDHATWSNKLS